MQNNSGLVLVPRQIPVGFPVFSQKEKQNLKTNKNTITLKRHGSPELSLDSSVGTLKMNDPLLVILNIGITIHMGPPTNTHSFFGSSS